MTPDHVWDVLRRHVLAVLSDLDDEEVRPELSLKDLGANSLDRMDILVGAMEELQLNLPPGELTGAPTLGALTDLLRAHCERS
ncbi:phosphopantetheine-binding protein [Streptomyces sp. NPDC006654]|uniref:phosphopantetheine-binding protein n=1 Tax=Streptomyces sp. NPDC006654 TaxID=3156897 RepID=UPI0033C23B6D